MACLLSLVLITVDIFVACGTANKILEKDPKSLAIEVKWLKDFGIYSTYNDSNPIEHQK